MTTPEFSNWRQEVPHTGSSNPDQAMWQREFTDRYRQETTTQATAWNLAVAALIRYGRRGAHNLPLENLHSRALFTGALVIDEPIIEQAALLATVICLDISWLSQAQEKQVPYTAIKTAQTAGRSEKREVATNDAAQALNQMSPIIDVSAYQVSTDRDRVDNEHGTRVLFRECTYPQTWREKMRVRWKWGLERSLPDEPGWLAYKDPEIAIWASPLHRVLPLNLYRLEQPKVPELPPIAGGVEEFTEKANELLTPATEQQPLAATVVDMLTHVYGSLRTLPAEQRILPTNAIRSH